jgi:hypothetical protein
MPGGATAVKELAVLPLKLTAGVFPKLTAVGLPRKLPPIVTNVPPAGGPAFGRTLVTVPGGVATDVEAMTSDGSVHPPGATAVPPITAVIVPVVPVETVIEFEPELAAVNDPTVPGETRGGFAAVMVVTGISNVASWLAGVAPVAVKSVVKVPEIVFPRINVASDEGRDSDI